ncbi:MAG: hypothetical protein ABSE86_12855, partial [Bryobacteraceae bacterium]
ERNPLARETGYEQQAKNSPPAQFHLPQLDVTIAPRPELLFPFHETVTPSTALRARCLFRVIFADFPIVNLILCIILGETPSRD